MIPSSLRPVGTRHLGLATAALSAAVWSLLAAPLWAKAPTPDGQGMIAYYRFDVGPGIPAGADFSGLQHTGNLFGASVLDNGSGRWAASFSGNGCLVADGNFVSQGIGGTFELMALVCPTALNPAGSTIVGRDGMFSLSLTGDGRVRAAINTASGLQFEVRGTSPVAVNSNYLLCQWQQVGASFDGGQLKVYYNGRTEGAVAIPSDLLRPAGGFLYAGGTCSCGSSACVAQGFSGLLDDVKVSNGTGPCSREPNRNVTITYAGLCTDRGGSDIVATETILDDDNDGVEDCLEEELTDSYAMNVFNDVGDGCPGPNAPQLRVCRAWNTGSNGWNSGHTEFRRTAPAISCAVLYQTDCGSGGHTADVEPYQRSFFHAGTPTPDGLSNGPGTRSDRNLGNWYADVTLTEAHQGTVAERDNYCYGNCVNIVASRDKHGNYQSVGSCNGGPFDSCGTMAWNPSFRNLEVGEPAFQRVPDLGAYYGPWSGWSPWDSRDFLFGGAGKISDKFALSPPQGPTSVANTCASRCDLNRRCCLQAGNSQAVCDGQRASCLHGCDIQCGHRLGCA